MDDTQDTQDTQRIKFLTDYKSPRALIPPFRRADLGFWGAIINGPDPRMGLDRQFLQKTFPAQYARRAQHALDFSRVRAGQIVQLRGRDSGQYSDEKFWLIVSIDGSGLDYIPLTNAQVARLHREPAANVVREIRPGLTMPQTMPESEPESEPEPDPTLTVRAQIVAAVRALQAAQSALENVPTDEFSERDRQIVAAALRALRPMTPADLDA